MAKFKKPSFTFPTLLESKDKRSVSPVHKSFKSGYHAGGSAVHSPQETAKMQAEQMFKAQTGQMAAQPATQTPIRAIDPSKQTQRLRSDQLTAERPTTTVTPMTAEQRAEMKRQLSFTSTPIKTGQAAKRQAEKFLKAQQGMVSPEGQAKGISDTGPRKRPTTTGVQQATKVGGPADLTIKTLFPKGIKPKGTEEQRKAYERVMEQMVDRSKPLTELEQAQVREGAKNPNFFDDTPPPGETIDTSNRDVRRARTRRSMMMEQASRRRRPINPMRPRSPFPTPFPRTSPTNVPFGRSIRNSGLRKLLGVGPPPPQQKGTTTKAKPVRKLTPQTAPPSFKPPARDPNAPPGYYDQVQLAQMNKGGVTKKSKKRKK